MGSIETPTNPENGSATLSPAVTAADLHQKPHSAVNGTPPQAAEMTQMESDSLKKRRSSVLPLEVGTRVMCRWRDGKYHQVKVIERRKMQCGGPNDYEYYVHYTECEY